MKKYLPLILWIAIFELIAWAIGAATQKEMYPWYTFINKPVLNPPSIVFPIVWSVLYALLAISAYCIWQNRRDSQIRIAGYFFSIQIFMNWSWSFLFFSFHLLSLSFFWIIGIIIFTVLTIFYSRRQLKLMPVLLAPYILWLMFAAYLNGAIVLLN